jgi:hypothetical protein
VFTLSRRRRPPITLLGRSGCVYLIPASKSYLDHFWAGRAVSNSFRRRRVTQNTFRPVGLRLPHSGVEGHRYHFSAGRAVSISLRRQRVTQNTLRPVRLCLPHSGIDGHQVTSGPVALYLSHFGVEKSPKTLLGRWGCVYLIPASTATKATSRSGGSLLCRRVTQFFFRPVGLC